MKTIPLTNSDACAVVDDEDYDSVMQHTWYRQRRKHTSYAQTEIRGIRKKIAMHRLILRDVLQPRQEVDHRDGDGLNNRRGNLRPASISQNHANRRKTRGTSKYMGVHWSKSYRKWRAVTRVNKKFVHLGWFDSEELAAKAYDAFVIKTWGEFAKPNFPPEVRDGK